MDVLDTDLNDSRMKSPAMSLPLVCKYRLIYSFSASVALSFHQPTAVSLSWVPAIGAQSLQSVRNPQSIHTEVMPAIRQQLLAMLLIVCKTTSHRAYARNSTALLAMLADGV